MTRLSDFFPRERDCNQSSGICDIEITKKQDQSNPVRVSPAPPRFDDSREHLPNVKKQVTKRHLQTTAERVLCLSLFRLMEVVDVF